MFPRFVAALILVTALALTFALQNAAPTAPPAPTKPGGLAPFEGRATLDHQGQLSASMPGDEKMQASN